jgi:DegV family protein with EDD domain
MRTVKIITDSASDLPAVFFEKYDISMLPMGVIIGDKTYLDRVDMDSQTFFRMMQENPESLPKTVMPSVDLIAEEFRKNLQTFKHQIYVCISSNGSGTYNIANMIKNEIEEQIGRPSNITIIDSRSFSAGYGMAVREMAKHAFEGADFNTVMSIYKKCMKKTSVFLVVDDLNHLKRGGRINPSVALVGGMLGIKPLLTIKNGLIDGFGKERGKRRSMEKIIELMLEKIKQPEDTKVWLVHTDAHDDVQLLKQMILQKITPSEMLTIELGACIGTHTGGGLVGIVVNS